METLSSIGVPLLAALLLGLVIGWLFGRRGKSELESQVHSLQESANAQSNDIAKAYAQVRSQEQRIQSLLAVNADLESQAKTAEERLADATAQLAQLRQELDAARAASTRAQAELGAGVAEYDDLADQFAALKATNEQLRSAVAAKQAEADRLSGLVNSLQQEVETLRKELDYARLTAPAQPAVAALRTASVSSRVAAPRIGAERASAPTGEVSVISADEALTERDRALSDAYTQIEALRYSLSALTALSADLSNTLEERNRAYEALLSRAAGIPEVSAPQAARLAAPPIEPVAESATLEPAEVLAAKIVEREAALSNLEAELATLRQELEAATQAKAELEAQLSGREAELSSLRDQAAAWQVELESATAATSDLEALLRARDEVLQTTEEQLAALQAELAGATAAKEELEEQLQQREAELAERNSELATLQANLDALLAEKSDIAAQLATHTGVLEELDYRLAAVQADLLPFLPVEEPVVAPMVEAVEAEESAGVAVAAAVEGAEPTTPAEAVAATEEAALPAEPTRAILARATLISDGVLVALAALKAKSDELAEANTQLLSLEDQVNGLAADKTSIALTVEEKEAALADAQAQVAALQAQVDELTAQLNAVNAEMDRWQAELQPLLGAEAPAEGEEAATAAEVEGAEPGEHRMARTATLAAGVTAAASALKQRDEELAAANDAIATLQGQLDALSADKAGLEATLAETQQALAATQEQAAQLQASVDNLSAQVDMLNQQMAAVQEELQSTQAAKAELEAQLAQANAELEGALAAKADLEAELQERNAELADLNAQISGFQELLQPFMEGEMAPEAEEEARAGRRLVRMGALTAGVTGAVHAVRQRDDELAAVKADLTALQEQLDGLNLAKASLEATVQEKEQALADTQTQLVALQASVDDLTAQVDALRGQVSSLEAELTGAQMAKAELETTLAQRTAELTELTTQLESIQAELAPFMGQAEAEEAVEGEIEPTRGAALIHMGAITAGVAAATSAMRDKDQLLDEARMQAAALAEQLQRQGAELAALETRLAETTALLDAAPAVAEVTQWLAELPPAKRVAANAAIREGALPYKTPRPQKLAEIVGIGKVFEQRLYDAGMGTFWEVSQIDDEYAQTALDITDWQMMRLDLDEVRRDALRLAQETNTVGAIWEKLEVDDFEVIEGIGPVFERRLYEAGLHRYADLANATVEQLDAICRAPKLRTPDYAAWIAQAQQLAAAETHEQPGA